MNPDDFSSFIKSIQKQLISNEYKLALKSALSSFDTFKPTVPISQIADLVSNTLTRDAFKIQLDPTIQALRELSVSVTSSVLGQSGISESISAAMDSITSAYSAVARTSFPEISVPTSLLDRLQDLSDAAPDEAVPDLPPEVTEHPSNSQSKYLPGDIVKLILGGFLLPFLASLLVKYMPDPTADKVLQNQEIQIQYEDEQIKLSQKRNDLLQEGVDLLQDIVLSLDASGDLPLPDGDKVDGLDDLPDRQTELDPEDSQEADNYAKN